MEALSNNGFYLYSLDQLLQYQEPERPYIVQRLLYKGSKMIVGGTAKRGKSFVLHDLLLSLAQGTPVFGNPDFPVIAPVSGVLFSQELGPQELQRRWQKHTRGQPPGNLFIVPRSSEVRLDTSSGEAAICHAISAAAERLGRIPEWIALDPISKFHTLDENEQRSIATIMKTIERIQHHFDNCAVIMVHHYGHPSEMKVAYRHSGGLLRGSTHFYADVDTIVSLLRKSPINARAPKFKVYFETRHGEPLPAGFFHLDPVTMGVVWDKYESHEEAENERPADPE